MPQVDYSHIPFNETAETRRRPRTNNQQTRLDSIIGDITQARQNRPRINSNDVFRGSVTAHSVNSDNRSFIQTHPFLFFLTILIMIIAIISALGSSQNFPMHSVIGNTNPVSQAMPAQNTQASPSPETNSTIYFGWQGDANNNEQNTEGQETETPYSESENDSVNDINTEVTPAASDQLPAQAADNHQPQWMTDPPDVFMRTRYVR